MKRSFVIILAVVAAGALFAGLVHVVLVAAHVSEPAATTVYGLTPRRLWATIVAVLALVAVVIGGLTLARPFSRLGTSSGRLGATLALVMGLIAAVNGGLNVVEIEGDVIRALYVARNPDKLRHLVSYSPSRIADFAFDLRPRSTVITVSCPAAANAAGYESAQSWVAGCRRRVSAR